jgi:histidinol-phosphatase
MRNQKHSPELETALLAARTAGEISRKYYRSNLAVEIKADRTPVTQADVACEKAIREIILQRFPEHGFFGEETGQTQAADSEYLWLVDPIDGTKGFIRQYPFFSTQIALVRNGLPIVGVSNGVMFDELAWAEQGKGAWLNGERLHTSDIDDLSRAALSTGNLKSLAKSKGWRAFGELVASVDRIRGYGDFYQYHLLAAGKIDAVIESDVNVLDIAALSVLVVEAGGVFTDLSGKPPGLETTSVLAANKPLHSDLLQRLGHWDGM